MTYSKKDWTPIRNMCDFCRKETSFAGFKICSSCFAEKNAEWLKKRAEVVLGNKREEISPKKE